MIVQIDAHDDTIDLAIVFADKSIAVVKVCDAIESADGLSAAPMIIVEDARQARSFVVRT